jgi:hypothetical protein
MNHKSIIAYLAILGIIGLSITAQAQTEFAPVGATWSYSYKGWSYNFNGSWEESGAFQINYEKDTLINDTKYKLLRKKGVHYSNQWSNNEAFEFVDKLFIRQQQDTIYAFKRIVNNGNEEDIYFVFLEKPDSIIHTNTSWHSTYGLYIDSVKTVEVEGYILKTWIGKSHVPFLMDGYSYDVFPLQFIERLGPVNDVFEYFGFRAQHPSNQILEVILHCYTDDEWGELNLSGIPCDLILSDMKYSLNEQQWSCFVVGNMLHFEFQEQSSKYVQLFNLQGKSILNTKMASSSIELPTNLPTGIYMIHLFDDSGNFKAVKKIFIQL